MSRRVQAATGEAGVVLPRGWVLDDGDTVVIPDAEWAEVTSDAETLGRLEDLGFTSDLPTEVPSFRDIQRAVAGGDVGLQGQIDTLESSFTIHTGDTTSVHGIDDTSLLETKAGAQAKADQAEADANLFTNQHAAQTTNVHGIANTANLAEDDVPSLTLIFENGLV